jgi:hypothetical protein
MIVSAHQPLFIPWIGYFDKINKVDLFVLLDDVQYTSTGWINRNSIKNHLGSQNLSVPIIKKKKTLEKKINEVKIDNKMDFKWKSIHLKAFQLNYGKATYFKEIFALMKKIYGMPFETLSNFDINFIKLICDYLRIETKLVLSSELGITGRKTDLIIDTCIKTNATSFMLGMGGSRDYADRKKMESAGIKIVEQNFKHPSYNQLFGEFIPNLSVLDLLFNEGPNAASIIANSSKRY